MPVPLPPVNGVSWSEAAAEAMQYATVDRVLLDCISFEHPSLSTPLHLVADYNPLTATLETGGTATFNPAALAVKDLEQSEDGRPVLVLQLSGVGGIAAQLLRAAALSTTPITLVHRVYASDDLTGPARLPVTRLEVSEAPSVDAQTVELRAVRGNPIGRGYPAKSYTRAEYPGLRT
jgi:hypothetical protein